MSANSPIEAGVTRTPLNEHALPTAPRTVIPDRPTWDDRKNAPVCRALAGYKPCDWDRGRRE